MWHVYQLLYICYFLKYGCDNRAETPAPGTMAKTKILKPPFCMSALSYNHAEYKSKWNHMAAADVQRATVCQDISNHHDDKVLYK